MAFDLWSIVRNSRRAGDRARDQGAWQRAADHYRAWLASRPDDFAIWVQLGHMMGELDDAGSAEAAYVVAQGLRPDDADLALCRGHLARKTGMIAAAHEFYRRSFELDGNSLAAHALGTLNAQPAQPAQSEPSRQEVEAEAKSAANAVTKVFPGRVEGIFEREVRGFVRFDRAESPLIEFRSEGRVIGRTLANIGRKDGERGFRALLDVSGGATSVSAHLLPSGEPLEGSPVSVTLPEAGDTGGEGRHKVLKRLSLVGRDEAAILVAHAPGGRLPPHVAMYLQALGAAGIATLLVVHSNRPVALTRHEIALAAGVMIREDLGDEFAGWAHALHLNPELFGARLLLLLKDSLFGPVDQARFVALIDRVRDSAADLVGLTESHEPAWHLQSDFLVCRPRLLGAWIFHDFLAEVRQHGSEKNASPARAIAFATRIAGYGLQTETLFSGSTANNPLGLASRALVTEGLPFVSLSATFYEPDPVAWSGALAAAGFDMSLFEAVVAAKLERWTAGRDRGDLVAPGSATAVAAAARPLNVAFFGPWTCDDGPGRASRELLCAVRRTGARLNIHPIAVPRHARRAIAPAVSVCDFAERADIAIVDLDPANWHLLTADQRAAIGAAGKRIGSWTWEMEHLPSAWRADLHSVDRIWVSSRYCADVFARSADVPVDVVPYPVPLPFSAGADRAATLSGISIDPGRRVILHVFDGESGLVRENPRALIRAFDAAGLGSRGWSLLLKTRDVDGRTEAGTLLASLVEQTRDVVLIDRDLDEAGFDALIAAVDIYASPHCAEGGQTVARAMAAGKPVIATDYPGTRDLLDAGTGYPVRAHRWTLEHDHGRYPAGLSWWRIDEPALVKTLIEAADAVEAGEVERAGLARARVAERFSYDAVAGAIAASFASLGEESGRTSSAPDHRVDLSNAPDFCRLAGEKGVLPVPLSAEGALIDDVDAGAGEWIVFAPRHAAVDPGLIDHLLSAAAARPEVGIFYADDVAVRAAPADRVRLKPDFDRTLLVAQDYIGAPLFVRSDVLARLRGLRRSAATAVLMELVLRATLAGVPIARIPRVLLGHRDARVVALDADRHAVLRALPEFAPYDIESGRSRGLLALERRFTGLDAPRVTLVVPTRRAVLPGGEGTYIETLLAAIATTDWPQDRLTVIVGDDIAEAPDWAERGWPFRLRRLATPRAAGEPFNYASKMNRLWRLAEDEQIVFLNDDVRPTGPGWLRALQTFAGDGSVGGVGARLLYDDGRLQHAGIMPFQTAVVHAWLGWRAGARTTHDWALAQREWSMVTGAVFATRASLLDRVGGFDERFSLEFNDLDLCLRMRMLGLRIVYNPAAEFVHTEKASRGEAPPPGEEVALFLSRWSDWLRNDPAFHPRLRRDRFDLVAQDDHDAWYR